LLKTNLYTLAQFLFRAKVAVDAFVDQDRLQSSEAEHNSRREPTSEDRDGDLD
jgi:hypothetical protein